MSQPKFCAKCGSQLNENERFCGRCGEPVEAVIPEQQSAGSVQTPEYTAVPTAGAEVSGTKDKKKVMLAVIAAAAIVLLIVVIIVIINTTKYQKIDAKELFKIEFKGINGLGKCTAALNCPPSDYLSSVLGDLGDLGDLGYRGTDDEDEDAEYSDYFSNDKKTLLKVYTKAKDKGEAEDMRDALMKINKKSGKFEMTLDLSEDSGLSNGDKITCTVEYYEDDLKEAKIKLTNTEFEVEVKGLNEGTKLDIFEDFNVKFSGIDGKGEADYPRNSEKYPFISYCHEISKYELSNGDTFTVEGYINIYDVGDIEDIDPYDSDSGKYFTYENVTYIVENLSGKKDFVVEGLTELEEIDVFEGIEFKTKGALPRLRITDVITEGCPDIVKENVNFHVEDSDKEYKAGDKFVIKAYVYSSLEKEGYKAVGTKDSDGYYTKEFTVDEASYSKYLTADSPYEDFEKLDDFFAEQVKEFKQDNLNSSFIIGLSSFDGKITSFESFELENTYYADLPEKNSIFSSGADSCVYRVYKVKVKLDDKKKSTETFYVSFEADGPYLTTDGKAEVSSGYVSCNVEAKKNDLLKIYIKKEGSTVTEIKKGSSGASDKNDDSSSKADVSSAATDASSSKADSSASNKQDSTSSEMVP